MAEFLRRRTRELIVTFALSFCYPDSDGGFIFACDEEGNLLPDSDQSELGTRNLWECVLGLNETRFVGINRYETWDTEPAVIRCECGEELALWNGMTNTCDCGAEYNGSGQRLAPRHQWGWDTGESFYCSCGSCEECV